LKLIGHMNAAAAYREVVEEYAPINAAPMADLITFIRSRYEFQVSPTLSPEDGPAVALAFHSGKFAFADPTFGIGLLVMEPNGDAVQAMTTDQCELILNDLVSALDANFGYRLAGSIKKRSFVSNVVVEFDAGLETYMGKLGAMAAAINAARDPGETPFAIKRIAFGAPNFHAPPDQISTIEGGDFIIERRAGIKFETNRCFCSAPRRTNDHVALLERIEAIARGDAT
jgi:hypothetical protein